MSLPLKHAVAARQQLQAWELLTCGHATVQGLAQQVMQMGRNARSSLQAGPGRSRQQASVPAAEGRRSQPQGNGLPAAVLGLAAATLFLGPGLPMFLFSILPFLAAGSSPPRYALAGSPCPPRPSMGFQVLTFP